MKLLILLTMTLLSIGAHAADAKKILRKPNTADFQKSNVLGIQIPKECTEVVAKVADPEKTGDNCAAVADIIQAKAKEFASRKSSHNEGLAGMDDAIYIRQVSNAYYTMAAEKKMIEIGVREGGN